MGGEDEMELIKDLPEGLRRDIKRYLCLDLIRKVNSKKQSAYYAWEFCPKEHNLCPCYTIGNRFKVSYLNSKVSFIFCPAVSVTCRLYQ